MPPSDGPGSGLGTGPGPSTGVGPGPSTGVGPGMAAAHDATGVSLDPWDLPWAVELANGDRCTLLGGTLTVLAGQTAHYGCEQGGTILGEVQHQDARWTVNYLAQAELASRLVDVVAAWS
jgi:hypothetical protein